MDEPDLLKYILDSIKYPVVYVDNEHIIRYINRPAELHYSKKWGDITGKSIFHCHNERSSGIIREVYREMINGVDERMITDNERHRVYMRAVRDEEGGLLGYIERYEPPVKSK
jgi:DUF438 domain-containing protein